jgi:hypothetical protein
MPRSENIPPMSVRVRHVTVASAIVLLTAATVVAQQPHDPRGEAKAQLGPFNFTPSLSVKDFGIDTNVFNDAEEKRDFTVTVAPKVIVSVPFARRAALTTSVATDLVYYQKYASERSVNFEVKTRSEVFVRRVTLFAEPAYVRTRQPMSVEFDARAQREERGGQAGINVRVSRKTAVELGARVSRVEFDTDEVFAEVLLRETLNRESRALSASIRQDLTPVTAIVFRAEGGTERFALSPVRDADTRQVGGGVEFNPRALISGTVSVGFRAFEPRDPLLEPFKGVVLRTAIEYAIGDSTRFAFAADRDVNYSYEPLQPYFVIQGFNLNAERRLFGRFDLALGALRHQYVYRDLTTSDDATSGGRVDVVRTWSGSIGYRFARTARLGFGAALRSRESNSALHRTYQGIRFSATTVYGF